VNDRGVRANPISANSRHCRRTTECWAKLGTNRFRNRKGKQTLHKQKNRRNWSQSLPCKIVARKTLTSIDCGFYAIVCAVKTSVRSCHLNLRLAAHFRWVEVRNQQPRELSAL
jgi:hypothetical protein